MNRIVAAEQIASALGATSSDWRFEDVDPHRTPTGSRSA
jgi:hypothetical protein